MRILVWVEVAGLIRDARRAAALTQLELARGARTAQPAVAAYESGTRTPTLGTLERLLGACGHDVEVLARPRLRRGAVALAELAQSIAQDLREGREQDAVRLLFGFADDFRGSTRAGRIALIREEPPSTGDTRFDAALAGLAEFFAAERIPLGSIAARAGSAPISAAETLPIPEWVDGPTRFVEPWWFLTSRPAFHAYTLANTPAVFARHGVFVAREVFDRA